MNMRHFFGCLLAVTILIPTSAILGQEKKPPKITYEDDVQPIFRQKCFSCHNPDKKSGDLDLTNYGNLMLGGGSGEVIEAGDSSASYLYLLISHQEEPYMPPEQPKLPDVMIETIRKWIDGGVLETKASTAKLTKKKTFDLALKDAPTERPAVPPMPPRLSLEPITRPQTSTAVSAIATSPWSPLAAVASQKQVLLYNTQTLQLVGTLPFPEGVPQVLKFSRNGSLLLAGGGRAGATGKAIVWNIHTGERVFEVGDELDTVLAADISSDQTLIALGGPQRVVRIYSTESGRLLHELRKHTDWVCSIEFSPDSVLLATGDRNGGLFVWEGWTGREYLTLKAHTKCVTGISWRSDSNIVASCSEDESVRLWEMNNGGQVKNWGAHGGGAASIEFTRDGRLLTCGRDRVTKLWDQNGAQQRAFEAFTDLALRVSFCDETNRAIAGDWSGNIRVWNAVDGVRIGELAQNPPMLAERLDAANKLLAAKTVAHKPLADAYAAAQAVATKAQADLVAAQKVSADTKTAFDAATAKLNATKATATKATQVNEAAKLAVAKLAGGVPVLKEALAKAQQAGTNIKGDTEVANAIAVLKAVTDKRAAELAANMKAATVAAAALVEATKALTVADAAFKSADAAYKAAVANVTKLTPLVKPAQDKAAAAKAAADTAATAVATAQNGIKRWTAEIAFANQLRDLTAKRTEALAVLEQRETQQAEVAETAQAAIVALDKSKAELKAAQDAVVTAQKQAAAAQAELLASNNKVAESEKARVVVETAVTKLGAVVTPLNEAAAKAKEAAAKDAADKQLAAASAALLAVVNAKNAALVASKADLDVKTKAVAAAKVVVVAVEKKLVAANTAVTAAQKRAADVAVAMKPVEVKATAAKTSADAAAKTVDDAQKAVDGINAQIAAAKGIKTG